MLERKPLPTTALFLIILGLIVQTGLSLIPVPEGLETVYNVLFSILAYGLPAVLYYHFHAWQQAEGLRLQRRPSAMTCLFTVLAALVSALFLYVLLALWEVLLRALGLHLDLLVGTTLPPSMLVGILAMAMVPAVCEELMFRGLLLPSMERLGAGKAIALSGLVFALMHGNIVGLPAHILLGLVMGLLAWATDCLWVPMLYHFTYNGFLVWLSYRMEGLVSDETVAFYVTQSDVTALMVIALALLALWALLMYAVLRQGSVVTRPVQRSKAHWLFWLMLIVLLLVLLGSYAFQVLVLRYPVLL